MPDAFDRLLATKTQTSSGGDAFDRLLATKPKDEWTPTAYGFKVKDAKVDFGDHVEDTKQRDDGAVWSSKANGWYQKHPNGAWVKAPSEPVANKNWVERQVGGDALANWGRNISEGFKAPGTALAGLARDAGNALGVVSDSDYIKGIQQDEAAMKYKRALADYTAQGGFTQLVGELAPQIAAQIALKRTLPTGPAFTPMTSEPLMEGATTMQRLAAPGAERAAANLLAKEAVKEGGTTMARTAAPFAERAAAEAIPAATSAYLTTNGDANQRAKAGLTALTVTPLVMGGAEGVQKVAPKAVSGAKAAWKALFGDVPKVHNIEKDMVGDMAGKAGTEVQKDLTRQKAADIARGSEPFEALRQQGGTVDMNPALAKVDDLLARVEDSRMANPEEVTSALQKVRKVIAKRGAVGDWGEALDTGKAINEYLGEAMDSQKKSVVDALRQVRDAHQESLDLAGKPLGDAYVAAKEAWKKYVVPWTDPEQGGRMIHQFMKNPHPNDAMKTLAVVGPDKAADYIAKLSTDGKRAMLSGVMKSTFDAVKTSKDKGPDVLLSALEKRAAMLDGTMTGLEKAKLDGFKKLLTIASYAPGAKWGIGLDRMAQSALTNRVGSTLMLGTAEGVKNLFNGKAGGALLAALKTAKPGTPMFEDIIGRIGAIMTADEQAEEQ